MDDVLTPGEVADRLKVDRKTVVRWISSGRLVGFRAGGRWRTTRMAVDRFTSQPVATTPRKKSDRELVAGYLEQLRQMKVSSKRS